MLFNGAVTGPTRCESADPTGLAGWELSAGICNKPECSSNLNGGGEKPVVEGGDMGEIRKLSSVSAGERTLISQESSCLTGAKSPVSRNSSSPPATR